MDTLDTYRAVLEKTLTAYANIPYAYGEIKGELVFDRANDHYLLVNVGWDGDRRIHSCLLHLDIIDGKVWIQRDGTEEGIAGELELAGIPKDHIVLGFRSAELRQYTDYAIA